MTIRNVDQILTRVSALIIDLKKNAEPFSKGDHYIGVQQTGPEHFWIDNTGLIMQLQGDMARRFTELVSEIETFLKCLRSRDSIEAQLQSIISRSFPPNNEGPLPKNGKERWKALKTELEGFLKIPASKWQIIIPIEGLTSDTFDSMFGGIRFKTLAEDDFILRQESLSADEEHLIAEVDGLTNDSGSSKLSSDALNTQYGNIFKRIKQCAIVNVDALDQKAAFRIAWNKLRYTVDILNAYIDVAYSPYDAAIIMGDDVRRASMTVLLSNNSEEFTPYTQTLGPILPVSLPVVIQQGIRLGILKLGQALENSKSGKDSLQNTLLRATRWVGRANLTKRIEDRAVFYTIALETILLKNKEDKITEKFRRRIIRLLRDGNETPEVSSAINKLYEARSSIVHAGVHDISEDIVETLRVIAKSAIRKILMDETFAAMLTVADLQDWFISFDQRPIYRIVLSRSSTRIGGRRRSISSGYLRLRRHSNR